MAHTKHTPGPWRTHKRTKNVGIFADTPTMSSVPIAEVCGVCVDDVDANARLIAAAPDLLEASRLACLVMAKGNGLSYKDRQEAHEACIAAIAKAEGR